MEVGAGLGTKEIGYDLAVGEKPSLDLTVVMPCLNEADTLEACIEKAWRAMEEGGINGEIVVADNGSTD